MEAFFLLKNFIPIIYLIYSLTLFILTNLKCKLYYLVRIIDELKG